MTEMTDRKTILPAAVDRFVLQWGALGNAWGVNRSVGQIHALLYLSERPLSAETIVETLGIARSNVSNSLKELLAWGLVRRAAVKADRRDHYEAETDVWVIAALIAAGRKRREIDPALAALRAGVAEAQADADVHPVARERLEAMLDFTETISRWHRQMAKVPRGKLAGIVGHGAKILKFLPPGRERER